MQRKLSSFWRKFSSFFAVSSIKLILGAVSWVLFSRTNCYLIRVAIKYSLFVLLPAITVLFLIVFDTAYDAPLFGMLLAVANYILAEFLERINHSNFVARRWSTSILAESERISDLTETTARRNLVLLQESAYFAVILVIVYVVAVLLSLSEYTTLILIALGITYLAYQFDDVVTAYQDFFYDMRKHIRLSADRSIDENAQKLAYLLIFVSAIVLGILFTVVVQDVWLLLANIARIAPVLAIVPLVLCVLHCTFLETAERLRAINAMQDTEPEKDTVYLFSSNSYDMYGQNVLDIVSMPDGTMHHLRYRNKWVDPCFRFPGSEGEESQLRPEDELRRDYIGVRAVIVAADMSIAGEREKIQQNCTDGIDICETYVLYPLRVGIVEQIETDGPILHIYVRTQEYIDWREVEVTDVTESIQAGHKHRFDKLLKQKLQVSETDHPHKYPHDVWSSDERKYTGSGYYVSLIRNDNLQGLPVCHRSESPSAWKRILEVLLQVSRNDTQTHAQTVFFRLAGVERLVPLFFVQRQLRGLQNALLGRSLPTSRLVKQRQIRVQPTQSGYELKSGKSYLLELIFFYPNREVPDNFEKTTMKPSVDRQLIPFMPNTFTVNTRYDQQFLPLTPTVVTSDTFTNFTLHLDNGSQSSSNDENVSRPHYPRVDFVLKLTPQRYRTLIAFVLLFVAQLVTVLKDVPGVESLDGIVGFLAQYGSLIGPVLTTFTLFILFRRIPGIR